MADNLKNMMSGSLEKIKEMADVNTVIGDAITAPDGTMIIPVSKVSFGFVSGGAEFPSGNDRFGGGAGAGVTIKPAAFIVISPAGDVKLLEIGKEDTLVDSIISGAPELVAKIKALFPKKDKEDDAEVTEI